MTSPSSSNMESNSSSSRGGVQFRCALEEIRRISRLSSYQFDEIVAVWGDEDEQIERQQELKRDATEFVQGRRSSDNYTFTSVGLCDHVGTRKEEKVIARNLVWDAVLKEQDNQRVAQANTGHSNDIFKYNSALLAKACQQAQTYKSQQTAYEKAKELELEIHHQQKKKIPTNGSKLNFSQQLRHHHHHHNATASTASGKRKHRNKAASASHEGHSHRRRSKSCDNTSSDGHGTTSNRRRPESSTMSDSSLAISKASQHYPSRI